MMKAFGIPCGVYWIDRPWGLGRLGYDDFEIDPARLPKFREMVQWLERRTRRSVLWIAAVLPGQDGARGAGQGLHVCPARRPANGNNYPMVDFTNPHAAAYWQDGVAKLLKLGVAGFKLDRGEEDIPENGRFKIFDGRSVRENPQSPNPLDVLKAAYDVAKRHRGRRLRR